MSKPLHILVIDDSRRDRASLRKMLGQSSAAYVLHEASTYMLGLRSCRHARPDCILFDALNEGTVAAEALRDLKRRMNGRPVPVIVWTAASLPPLMQAAMQQVGASGWLQKYQTSPHELEQTIQGAVSIGVSDED